MKKKKIKFVATTAFLALIILIPFFTFAQETNLEIDYPDIGSADSQEIKGELPGYIKYIFNFSVAIAGFVLFGLLIRAGIIYLSSAGNPERTKKGKDLFLSSFLGVIVLLASYLILATINPQLVVFNLPVLQPPPQIPEIPGLPEWQEDEMSLIITELPIGQAIENGLWSEEMIDKIKELKDDNKKFLEEDISATGVNATFNRIADMNKYMLDLTEKCRCAELTGLCIGPKDFPEPVGCAGDPCPGEARDQIEKILDIDQEKMDELLVFQRKITAQKNEFAEELSKLVDIENEMVYCQQQSGTLINLSEHLSRLNFYYDQGWQIETINLPGVPKANADPLTFYCSSGGTISDHPYRPIEEPPEGISESETINIDDVKVIMPGAGGFNCPLEIPLGTVVDELREMAVMLIVKMERLADLQGKMASRIDNMKDLVSRCTDKNCKIDCDCIPNPCYEPACGTPPGRVNYCGIGRCIPPTPVTPNFCYPFCNSPCLQAVGGCHGFCEREDYDELSEKINNCVEQNCEDYPGVKGCQDACPRNQLMAKTIEIGAIEKEIFNTMEEIEQIFPEVNALIGRIENPKPLISWQDIREGTELCQSPGTPEGEGMELINCSSAIGNYGENGQIISDCHPRNFFCCLFSEIESLGEIEGFFPEMAYEAATKEYQPLPAIDGCPQGWLCEPEIKSYNQYDDASEPLKELLSCMRQELDKTIEEKELSREIGLISVISDPKLSQRTCDWEAGPVDEEGCSHTYEIKHGKMRVSAHYGGPGCRFMKKSFAVDFSDTINAEYLISAAKKCRPDSFISFRTSQNYQGLHISLGQAEDCGVN